MPHWYSDLDWNWTKCKYCRKIMKWKRVGLCPTHGLIRPAIE